MKNKNEDTFDETLKLLIELKDIKERRKYNTYVIETEPHEKPTTTFPDMLIFILTVIFILFVGIKLIIAMVSSLF